jgi:hypothetical protein
MSASQINSQLGLSTRPVLCCVLIDSDQSLRDYLLGSMLIISPEILEEGTLDPANDTKLGVHILPMAFPWT